MNVCKGDRVEVFTRLFIGPVHATIPVMAHAQWAIALVLSTPDPTARDVLVKIGGHDPVRVPVAWLRIPTISKENRP